MENRQEKGGGGGGMEKRKDKITWVWCLETPPRKLK